MKQPELNQKIRRACRLQAKKNGWKSVGDWTYCELEDHGILEALDVHDICGFALVTVPTELEFIRVSGYDAALVCPE